MIVKKSNLNRFAQVSLLLRQGRAVSKKRFYVYTETQNQFKRGDRQHFNMIPKMGRLSITGCPECGCVLEKHTVICSKGLARTSQGEARDWRSESKNSVFVKIESGSDPRIFSNQYAEPLKITVEEKCVYDSRSIRSATAVLIYLAIANMLYGQTVQIFSTERQGDVKCQVIQEPEDSRVKNAGNGTLSEANASTKPCVLRVRSAASNVQPADAARISPADVYALVCERADEHKPWTEPSPLPGNVNRLKVNKPFQITIK